MKVLVAWLALAMAAALFSSATTSCSINHKSDAFTCEITADCPDGRKCIDNFCVDPSDPGVDARTDGSNPPVDAKTPDGRPTDVDAEMMPDAPTGICPNGCTSCLFDSHTCVVDCSASGAACGAMVRCPPTWNCDIKCNVDNSCRLGVNCTQGQDCNVQCTGAGSCRNVTCGNGACDVQCDGQNSCRGVECGNACSCAVGCEGPNACGDTVNCIDGCTFFDGCTADLLCNQCE